MSAPTEPEQTSVYIHGYVTINGELHWQAGQRTEWLRKFSRGAKVQISFKTSNLSKHFRIQGEMSYSSFWRKVLEENEVSFLHYTKGIWYVNALELKKRFPNIDFPDWLPNLTIKPYKEYRTIDDEVFGEPVKNEQLTFVITEEEAMSAIPKGIFLSHKSANKPIVREYSKTLEELGLSPWLDEEAMPAGVKLNRALLEGMRSSCAAVFFVTPDYQDESFLEAEIDYAIDRKREEGDRFSIIILQLEDEQGNKGIVPGLLRPFVWKTISHNNHLQGLREILKALPFSAKIQT